MVILKKIRSIFSRQEKTVRQISIETGIPKSTVHHHKGKISNRVEKSGTDFWETEAGMNFIIRWVVGLYVYSKIRKWSGSLTGIF